MNLIDRVKTILLSPRDAWPRIAAEPATVQSIYIGYIVVLAAIGPVATLVSFAVLGLGFGLGAAVFAYVHSLVGVAILALIVDVLAPTFGGARDYVAALKLVAYSFTALWVAQIALLIPVAGGLIVLIGLVYAFYLFFLGVPVLKKSTVERAIPFTLLVVVSAIVLMYLLAMIARGLGFGFGIGTGPLAAGPMGVPR
ncbi:MAG TPA: Yip1 family protein [Casimicrobiaceae bacterium]|nr:Yip1 family protein [Casimicrobiaceae bacterium]